MKVFVIFFLVCMAVLLTKSAVINPEKHKSGIECKTVALEASYYNENEDEERIQTSNEESPCRGDDCSENTAQRTLSTSVSLQQPELEILENVPAAPNYFYGFPLQRSYDWNGQRIINIPDLRSSPYSGIQYYAHPPLFTAYSPTYFPPAVPTYARKAIPELHSQIYQRPVRVVRSRQEDDFMAELQHMAIMNNILPTMSIPFLRSTSYGNVPYEAPSFGGATAVFPVSASNCALPLLFSCSPQITRGNLAKPLPSDHSHPQKLESAKEHIKQMLHKAFVVEDKSGSSEVDDSSSESFELADVHGNGNYKEPTMNAIDRALKPKHVADENNAISDKKHTDTLPTAHVTS